MKAPATTLKEYLSRIASKAASKQMTMDEVNKYLHVNVIPKMEQAAQAGMYGVIHVFPELLSVEHQRQIMKELDSRGVTVRHVFCGTYPFEVYLDIVW